MSVNDCIVLHNNATGSSLPPITEEQALARTLNSLEEFLNMYQETEMTELLPLYYKYWLHRYACVCVPVSVCNISPPILQTPPPLSVK